MTRQEIRVTPVRETSRGDIDALQTWLTRERIVRDGLGTGELRVEQRPKPDTGGSPMGLGNEIVLVLLEGAAGYAIGELIEQTRSAVREWQENRRSLGEDRPPDFDVTSDDDAR
ncbi:hypothetical protein [Streptomyces sp. NPDC050856]|uniref:hypothetical protein n=1 Tax=unclassified Streptomyces TaxID=2593676 RepID=UPI0033F3DC33